LVPEIPPRDATRRYFENMRRSGLDRTLDIEFDVDLGELIPGHRVVLRGIELASGPAQLHYEFVPGMTDERIKEGGPLFWWFWLVHVADDVGTTYSDDNGGAFDTSGGPATHGVQNLGGEVPPTASRLTLAFEAPEGWNPPIGSTTRLEIDLRSKTITDRS
jgi:hypothetical protein